MRYGWGMSKDEQHPTENPTGPGDTPPTAKEGAWSDVELVERAERLGDSFRTVGGIPSDPCPAGCISCRGAALWQTLDGLRGLRLVSPTTGQRQGGGHA